MPIEDIPFYTVMGEEISRNILVEKMIQYYQLKLNANLNNNFYNFNHNNYFIPN